MNDRFRTTMKGGRIVLTHGVASLSEIELTSLLKQVRSFASFTRDNDPHDEHDFGAVDYRNERYFWKIDYYDRSLDAGSEDPSNPALTTRVLTVMRADEY